MTSIAMEEEDPNVIHDSLKLIHRSENYYYIF